MSSRFLADLRTIPNLLSLSRLVGLPLAAVLYIYGFRAVGLTLGTVAALTDLLDGYLARKLAQTTLLGAILDRLGDLVFETTAFVCIVHFQLMSPIVFFVYLVREIVVLSARQFVAAAGDEIKTNVFGRLKTDFIAIAVFFMFAVHAGAVPDERVAHWIFRASQAGIVAGLVWSYVSGAQYLAAFARVYDRSGQA
jgi:CDP-diacylglycerol--glycerol-3-phosphate 3-phosphatidyltransferase